MQGARAGEQARLQAASGTSAKVSASVGSLQRGILPDCAATEHIQLVQTQVSVLLNLHFNESCLNADVKTRSAWRCRLP